MHDLVTLVRTAEATYRTKPAARAGDQTFTFADVADRSDRAATVVRGHHGAGDGVVALLVGNRIEAVELDAATIKAGLARVSINPRLAYDELQYVVGDVGARVLLYDPQYSDVVDQLRNDHQDLVYLRLDGKGDGPGVSYEDELAAAAPTREHPVVTDDSPSLLMYTSGTTGRPKGAT